MPPLAILFPIPEWDGHIPQQVWGKMPNCLTAARVACNPRAIQSPLDISSSVDMPQIPTAFPTFSLKIALLAFVRIGSMV